MKLCQSHWDKLKAKISELGLEPLVAKSGEEAAAKALEDLKRAQSGDDSGMTKETFDPLMGANYAIWSNALHSVGLVLMEQNEDGSDRCPLCFMQTTHDKHCTEPECKQNYDDWITYAVRDMHERAKELGLIGTS